MKDGVQEPRKLEGTRGLIIGFLSKEGYSYEKRLQNLLYYSKQNDLDEGILEDIEFEMTVDGPFSDAVRDEISKLIDADYIQTKTDIDNGLKLTRYIPKVSLSWVSETVKSVVENVYELTKNLSTKELVREHMFKTRKKRMSENAPNDRTESREIKTT